MNTLTLRRIPAPVERSLRRIAGESHQSLNKTAIDLIAKAAGVGPQEKSPRKRRDIKGVLHPWTAAEYKHFQRNIEAFETVDEAMWRR